MKREKTYRFSGKNSNGDIVASGDIVEAKVFPASRPGRSNLPLVAPPNSSATFQDWVDYYAGLVSHFVPVLNGLQFDYDLEQKQLSFENAIGAFGEKLGATVNNPLKWPLAGRYEFGRGINRAEANTELLTVFFECDPDTSLVLNASVQLRWDKVSSPANNMSSSSSYLATSSSSNPYP